MRTSPVTVFGILADGTSHRIILATEDDKAFFVGYASRTLFEELPVAYRTRRAVESIIASNELTIYKGGNALSRKATSVVLAVDGGRNGQTYDLAGICTKAFGYNKSLSPEQAAARGEALAAKVEAFYAEGEHAYDGTIAA